MEQLRIIIDALGSDSGVKSMSVAINKILTDFPEVCLTIVGDQDELIKNGVNSERVDFIDIKQTISNTDNIFDLLHSDTKFSILEALKLASSTKNIGVITAGNSGAALLGSMRYLSTIDQPVPCLAVIFANAKGKCTCLVDAGASLDCSAGQLQRFAQLGSNFMKKLYNIDQPRVGLLSVGTESTKGNKITKEAYKLLAADVSINFVGNVESNKLLNDVCDVMVCDGFAGNQVIKSCGGVVTNLIKEIMVYSMTHDEVTQKVCQQIVGHITEAYKLNSIGNGVILGANQLVIKCHGDGDPDTIKEAAHILVNVAKNKTLYD